MTNEQQQAQEELRDVVLEKEREGKVVFYTALGLRGADIDELIDQPAEGLFPLAADDAVEPSGLR